ncbi:MAG TPA: hypothetical protein PLE19_05995 [Planctomycetota bacterium]|nr:hypothetical protein [Planctomycetota bacterium]HRR80274.1 hypothetical protein [Planctomycetota bacterium]HRT93382.1 hypothetical protein [Planctomycetota bacterium]
MTLCHFTCHPEGYLRHWLIAGPHRTPYAGPSGSDDDMRRAAVDPAIADPPTGAELGRPGPNAEAWRFYAPGQNVFVECSGFSSLLETLDLWAMADVIAPFDASLAARLWACGTADLWVNGAHVLRHDVPRYMYPEAAPFVLPLHRGANRVCVRLHVLGVRDTRMLFGLQVLDEAADLAVRLPGAPAATAQLAAAERWLMGVRAAARDALASEHPAPEDARVAVGPGFVPWPAGARGTSFAPTGAFALKVSIAAAGQTLERALEIPANRPPAEPSALPLGEHRREHVRHFAQSGERHILNVLARRLLGERADESALFEATLKGIDERRDCSDFTLAALLRMVHLGLVSPDEEAAIRTTALAFRYWDDEPGTDAMCFGSENHSLLFHGCQLLAGRLWPHERFSNSGRTGAEQAALGLSRCAAWLAEVEPVGFREYLSSTYMPLTVAALMNVVDFSGDAALAQRAAAVVDGVFRDLAMHAFDGVVMSPQGRVYRNVLYPETGGTQALLSYATPEAVVAHTNWISFLAGSCGRGVSAPRNAACGHAAHSAYQPPDGLGDLMRQPACRRYRQDGVEVVLHKTTDYLLTSLAIPASFDFGEGAAEMPANWRAALWPGKPGYQQHLWQASLARDCHVFVNHPGGTFDGTQSRPGYWYGNGSLPSLSQTEGTLAEIFDIPDAHPVGFTHAHWPSDAFDRQEVLGHWAFGRRGTGAVALWCSQPLAPHDDVLTGRELRAAGRRVAWVCLCGPAPDAGAFEAFVRSCAAMAPAFDASARRLRLGGETALEWTE